VSLRALRDPLCPWLRPAALCPSCLFVLLSGILLLFLHDFLRVSFVLLSIVSSFFASFSLCRFSMFFLQDFLRVSSYYYRSFLVFLARFHSQVMVFSAISAPLRWIIFGCGSAAPCIFVSPSYYYPSFSCFFCKIFFVAFVSLRALRDRFALGCGPAAPCSSWLKLSFSQLRPIFLPFRNPCLGLNIYHIGMEFVWEGYYGTGYGKRRLCRMLRLRG